MSGAASSEGIPKSCFLAKSSAAFGSLPTLPLFSSPGFWLDDIGSLLYTPPVHVSSVSRHGESGSGEFRRFAVEHIDHIADHPAHIFDGGVSAGGHVGGEDDVVHSQEREIRRRRFGMKDIDGGGGEFFIFEGVGQGVDVENFAAGSVDEK